MSTLALSYVQELRARLRSSSEFTGVLEDIPDRAIASPEPAVVSLQLGAETVDSVHPPRANRARELQLRVYASGDDAEALTDLAFEQAHPIIMQYAGEKSVEIAEVETDESKKVEEDSPRQIITRRYRISYQTDQHSLTHQ